MHAPTIARLAFFRRALHWSHECLQELDAELVASDAKPTDASIAAMNTALRWE
jgi:hypothetical protein